jgi:hypothetical protein
MQFAQAQKLSAERGLTVVRSPYKDGNGGYCIESGAQQIQGPNWCSTIKVVAAKLATLQWQDGRWMVCYF